MYRSSRAIMEEVNYFNDRRVRNAERYNNRDVDEQKMVIRWEQDDEGEAVMHEFPARFEVCPTCEGRGTHVNPSIDASGYYPDEDDDNGYDYEASACGTCHGKRVVLEIDRRACELSILLAYDAHLDDLDECDADRLAELRAGC